MRGAICSTWPKRSRYHFCVFGRLSLWPYGYHSPGRRFLTGDGDSPTARSIARFGSLLPFRPELPPRS